MILTALITIISTLVGILIGVHMGRRFYGLTNRWEGWDVEFDWLVRAIRGQ